MRGNGGDDVLSGDEDKDRRNGGPGEDTCYVDTLDIVRNCEVIVP